MSSAEGVAPSTARVASRMRFTPSAFEMNGKPRDARRLHSMTFSPSSLTSIWTLNGRWCPALGPKDQLHVVTPDFGVRGGEERASEQILVKSNRYRAIRHAAIVMVPRRMVTGATVVVSSFRMRATCCSGPADEGDDVRENSTRMRV